MAQIPPKVPPLVPPGATFAFGASPFRTKGVLYLGTQSFFETNLQGGMAAFVEELDHPELRAFVTQKFLASSWYDVMPVPALIAYEAQALRMPLDAYLVHRTRWQAKSDLSGVYGWVLKLASPRMVATRLPKIFAQVFNFAIAEGGESEPARATASLGGIPEPLERWLTAGVSIYCDTALKLAGARKVDVVVTSEPAGERAGVPLVKLLTDVTWT